MDVQVVELLMQVDKRGAQVLQYVERYRCIVDEGPGFAGRRDLPPNDHLRIKVQVMLIKEAAQVISFDIKKALDGALGVQIVEGLDVRTPAHDQAQRAQQNRLTGPGFTSNNGEPLREVDRQLLDDGVIPDVKALNHSECSKFAGQRYGFSRLLEPG